MNAMLRARLAAADRSETGGWFCYGCRCWTELDLDREQNVCVLCGRPTVRLLPPRGTARRPEPVKAERARELFAAMREAVE